MRKLYAWTLVGSLLGTLACRDLYDFFPIPCPQDGDCPEPFLCVDGYCTETGCNVMAQDCPEGYTCKLIRTGEGLVGACSSVSGTIEEGEECLPDPDTLASECQDGTYCKYVEVADIFVYDPEGVADNEGSHECRTMCGEDSDCPGGLACATLYDSTLVLTEADAATTGDTGGAEGDGISRDLEYSGPFGSCVNHCAPLSDECSEGSSCKIAEGFEQKDWSGNPLGQCFLHGTGGEGAACGDSFTDCGANMTCVGNDTDGYRCTPYCYSPDECSQGYCIVSHARRYNAGWCSDGCSLLSQNCGGGEGCFLSGNLDLQSGQRIGSCGASGAAGQDQSCLSNQDCREGHECRVFSNGNFCLQYCGGSVSCPAGYTCAPIEANVDGAGVCAFAG